jgi:hypothetical protein
VLARPGHEEDRHVQSTELAEHGQGGRLVGADAAGDDDGLHVGRAQPLDELAQPREARGAGVLEARQRADRRDSVPRPRDVELVAAALVLPGAALERLAPRGVEDGAAAELEVGLLGARRILARRAARRERRPGEEGGEEGAGLHPGGATADVGAASTAAAADSRLPEGGAAAT